jgi:Zn-finger nucleic acid-binding protein
MTGLMCPTCRETLHVARDPSGAIWVCEKCAGAAASLAVLRNRLKAGMAADFWCKVAAGSVASQRPCASCGQPMMGFAMPLDGHTINLDLCKRCEFVWFDRGELESLPKALVKPQEGFSSRQTDAMLKVLSQNNPSRQLASEVNKAEYWVQTGLEIVQLLLRIL